MHDKVVGQDTDGMDLLLDHRTGKIVRRDTRRPPGRASGAPRPDPRDVFRGSTGSTSSGSNVGASSGSRPTSSSGSPFSFGGYFFGAIAVVAVAAGLFQSSFRGNSGGSSGGAGGGNPPIVQPAVNSTSYREAAGYREAERLFREFGSTDGPSHTTVVDALRPFAEAGDARAQAMLGDLNDDDPSTQAEAFKWYQRAAEQQDPVGCVSLGWCYERGIGTSTDSAAAKRWYEASIQRLKSAADEGDWLAQNQLAYCYHHGYGITEDLDLAIIYYRKASGNGVAFAKNELRLLDQPKVPTVNSAEYRQSSAYREAERLFRERANVPGRSTIEAIEAVRPFVAAGDARAQSMLGDLLDDDENTQEEAFERYRAAANQDDPVGCVDLAWCYENGIGTGADASAAQRWYSAGMDSLKSAASAGDWLAQYQLADCYQKGNGIAADSELALENYRKAAAQGVEAARLAVEQLGQSASSAEISPDEARSAIQSRMSTWGEAYARKDLGGVMAIVAPDFLYVRNGDRVNYQGEHTNYERLFAKPGVKLALEEYSVEDTTRLGPAEFQLRVNLVMKRVDPAPAGTRTLRFKVTQTERWRKSRSGWQVYSMQVLDSQVIQEDTPVSLHGSDPVRDRGAETVVREEIQRAASLEGDLIREGLEGTIDSAKLDRYMGFFAESFTNDKGQSKSSFRTSVATQFTLGTSMALSVSSCTYTATVQSLNVQRDGTVETEVTYTGRVRASHQGRSRSVRITTTELQRWGWLGGRYRVTYLKSLVPPRSESS